MRQIESGARLVVVGTGIALGTQLTSEARQAIEAADVVLDIGSNPLSVPWLQSINPNVESLRHPYEEGQERNSIYRSMADEIMRRLRAGGTVCVTVYGHPGVFAAPARWAIESARAAGFPARMIPGVSAEACMIADLLVDPGEAGWQSYEATDFLVRRRNWDKTTPLVLWQISSVGDTGSRNNVASDGLRYLAGRLCDEYGESHTVTLYLAPEFPTALPLIDTLPLAELADAEIPPLATLYVPPRGRPPIDVATATALGLNWAVLDTQ